MKNKGKHSKLQKENIPIRKRKTFQLEKGKYSNKKIIPIRNRKIFQLVENKIITI